MSFQPFDYLRHILTEAEFLLDAAGNVTEHGFLEDGALRRAFVRSFEIIGEAAKKVPEDLRKRHPQVHWSDMARMRDRLIHAYFDVDYEVVWDIVQTDIPELKRQLESILVDEDAGT
ncbi:MAG: DUF86 domain-containing protein [Gemmatimonadetes bacterium]|nr:DUF86 domain-containing protein [Gemmatimonadota bacterium]